MDRLEQLLTYRTALEQRVMTALVNDSKESALHIVLSHMCLDDIEGMLEIIEIGG